MPFAFRSAVKQAVSYAEGRVTQRIESAKLAAEAAVPNHTNRGRVSMQTLEEKLG